MSGSPVVDNRLLPIRIQLQNEAQKTLYDGPYLSEIDVSDNVYSARWYYDGKYICEKFGNNEDAIIAYFEENVNPSVVGSGSQYGPSIEVEPSDEFCVLIPDINSTTIGITGNPLMQPALTQIL